MSNITNEPIILDSTAREMVDRMDKTNALLAMIAEGNRQDIYSNISQIASIVRGGTVETNSKLFPIGDQIVVPWMDMDDTNHNTPEKAYQVPLDIVHHDLVTLESGETLPGMFLAWHYCSPYGLQFSNYQAFKDCPDGLTKGTYNITIGANWGTNAVANTKWSFTLTQDVPKGGRISGFEGMPDQLTSTWKVKTWATPDAASPIETVATVSGANGTSLGTLNMAQKSEQGLNGMQQTAYGHNRWKTSAMRQYLNKKGKNWWVSQEEFDIRPNEYAKTAFMSGFQDDFLAAIRPVKVTTALNTVESFEQATEDTYDTFFLASIEQMNANPQLANVEGPYWEYWRRRLGLSGFAQTYPTTYENYKIPAINAQTSPQYVRLRSADRGHAAGRAWHVDSSGSVGSSDAIYALRFCPVCVIC